ncbi:type IV secretory system conjugative DNA transfer family protein [Aquimarina spongiae]|uniref:Type IV secretory pathway, VirD4 component, TraG/TraD family ATPase n=1 Tax=Aquimarina spongiae TaxID=570521 RepID=A0A1M6J1U7_9FLAO|nr:type IV secretory system conjugative DNA transfer family protein [Aquimarina spongiae]SHJ40700.1 Type IV secretory pathway, VirD4 component, TraG/TraD family ATPase [Aquimarina spongiae]
MKDSKLSIDMIILVTMLLCIVLLGIDIYAHHIDQLYDLGMTHTYINKMIIKLYSVAPFLESSMVIRSLVLGIFSFASFGFHVKKKPEADTKNSLYYLALAVGTLVFVIAGELPVPMFPNLGLTTVALIAFIWALFKIRRHFNYFGSKDEFNDENLIFKQEQGVMTNPYSVNFKTDKGFINVVNPFRATMVLGTPGSGKSYSVIEEYIRQHIQKQFTMLVYDFKFPSLAKETYAFYQFYKEVYQIEPTFNVISLDDIQKSNFVNPLSPDLIRKAADAIEASQTVLYNLNKEWITKKDFFAQSAISYFASCIYFLKIYEGGKYCTLPHAITLASCPDEKVFKILGSYPELKFFMTPFADALEKEAYEQLSGQTASARIPLSQLATKELFWVMGNNIYPELNVSLSINDPEKPSLLVLANSPATQTTNSPALGLISTQILKEINTQGRQPCSVIIDELPTMYFMGLDNLIATARSNKISTTIGMQDLEQLKRDYGNEVAATIFNIVGNIFSGSVRSETATKLQEIFGKKKQKLKNISVDTSSTSYSINENLEYAIPVATISQLSQGEFVGVVADNFGEEINRKIFRGKIKVDQRNDQIKDPIPLTIGEDNDIDKLLDGNFNRIVAEIDVLVANELEKLEANYHEYEQEEQDQQMDPPN